jgi:hypothetical protein
VPAALQRIIRDPHGLSYISEFVEQIELEALVLKQFYAERTVQKFSSVSE